MKKIFFILFSLMTISVQAQVRIMLTAALTDAYFEFRKQQYLETFSLFEQYGFGPQNLYVVEALKKQGPTFLDDYSAHVFYSTVNNPNLRNNGINEALTMLDALNHFDFDPDDMIIKLTGRHQLFSDYFIKMVQQNSEYDAIVKGVDGVVVTAAFAMKNAALKQMLSVLDYASMEAGHIPLESLVCTYINNKAQQGALKVLFIDKLDFKAEIYGSSTAPGVAPQVIVW